MIDHHLAVAHTLISLDAQEADILALHQIGKAVNCPPTSRRENDRPIPLVGFTTFNTVGMLEAAAVVPWIAQGR